jgi:hypothetical protein
VLLEHFLGSEYRGPYETTQIDLTVDLQTQRLMLRRGKLQAREREIEHGSLIRLLRWLVDRPQPRPQDVAETAAALAALDLSIDTPRLLAMDYVQIRTNPELAGYARSGSDNTIVIALDQCAHRIAETTAHECRHRMQMGKGKFHELVGKGLHETDARTFTVEFMSKYLTGRCCPCGQ